MDRLTIVGSGPITASLGLALRKARLTNTEIIGTSDDRRALSSLNKLGAFDRTEGRLRDAIYGATLVILDVPIKEIKGLIEAIGPILEGNCTVTDTGYSKTLVTGWAEEYFPPTINFVGGHPLLRKSMTSLENADATVFQGTNYCIMPSISANSESVRTVVGLVEAIGANPLFLDSLEHDSYVSAMAHLPTVISAAYVSAITESPSWREMYRFASSNFDELSRLSGQDPIENETACLSDRSSLIHWIDQFIHTFYNMRNEIAQGSDELVKSFAKAWEGRAMWEAGIVSKPSSPHIPSAHESMTTAFLGDHLAKRLSRTTSRDDGRQSWQYPDKFDVRE